jgi:alkyl sulfatase BDS1-like metallo-beta-lactamase superfamily hydrolase
VRKRPAVCTIKSAELFHRADEVKSPTNQALKTSTKLNHENHPQTKSPRHRTGPVVDFENAALGLIGKRDTLTIKKAQGQAVWDLESYRPTSV